MKKVKAQAPVTKKCLVTGKVTDETGEPLIGISVLVKGTTMGTVTDLDGMFHLNGDLSDHAGSAGTVEFILHDTDISKGHSPNGLYLYTIRTETFLEGGKLMQY